MSRIQAQLKQRRKFRTLEEEVFVGLRLVADRVAEPWARVLRETSDLSLVQYNVLRILRGAGAEGLRQSEVAERLVTRAPDVSRMIDRLVQRGLAARHPDPEDGRAVRVHITDEGRDRLAPLDAQARAMIVRTFAGIGEARLSALRDTLDDVLAAIEAQDAE